jgi:hypothetical protein
MIIFTIPQSPLLFRNQHKIEKAKNLVPPIQPPFQLGTDENTYHDWNAGCRPIYHATTTY